MFWYRILGLGLFDFTDFSVTVCMSLGAITMLLYVLFRWKYAKLKESNAGTTGKICLYN